MTLYHAPPPETLRVEPLDQLTLVYHRPAGVTHLLAEPAPEILGALAEGPADVDTLLARLAAQFEFDPAGREGIVAHLDDLVTAGLVSAA